MNFDKSNKSTWVLHCLLLYSPFLLETFIVAPLMLGDEIEPLWGALFWVHTYITYGIVCLIHSKWRKKIDCKIVLKPDKCDFKQFFLAVLIGVIGGYLADIILWHGIVSPMIYRDLVDDFSIKPVWLGAGTFVMQYIYYIFEFTVVAFMVDCAQKTSIKLGWTQKIPWGGVFIAVTWGFGHYFSKGTLVNGLHAMVLCIFIGLAYMLPGKKPIYAWLAVAASYWIA